MLSESSKVTLQCFLEESGEAHREMARKLGPSRAIAIILKTAPPAARLFVFDVEENLDEAERFVGGLLGMT
jgi:hypothetical protein